jgi:hypothetical protein
MLPVEVILIYISIPTNQIDEISEIGTKLSKRCFKIVLKMGAIEQFKCPAKMVRLTHILFQITNLSFISNI